jgi:hypothetical protein
MTSNGMAFKLNLHGPFADAVLGAEPWSQSGSKFAAKNSEYSEESSDSAPKKGR